MLVRSMLMKRGREERIEEKRAITVHIVELVSATMSEIPNAVKDKLGGLFVKFYRRLCFQNQWSTKSKFRIAARLSSEYTGGWGIIISHITTMQLKRKEPVSNQTES